MYANAGLGIISFVGEGAYAVKTLLDLGGNSIGLAFSQDALAEPEALLLLTAGLLGFALWRRTSIGRRQIVLQ